MKKKISCNPTKRALFSILLTLVILTPLAGCNTVSSSKGTKVRLNEVAHSIFYAPMYVAIEEGYFEEEGLDIELTTGFGADKTMTALLSGEADIGFMGPESTIYTYQEGNTDYVVNFAQLTQRAGNFLVSREKIDSFENFQREREFRTGFNEEFIRAFWAYFYGFWSNLVGIDVDRSNGIFSGIYNNIF